MESMRERLLQLGAQLYSMGVELEAAKQELRKLVESGTPYESNVIIEAVNRYRTLEKKWQETEKQYLKLREELQERS